MTTSVKCLADLKRAKPIINPDKIPWKQSKLSFWGTSCQERRSGLSKVVQVSPEPQDLKGSAIL
jgi:hypothetical protein